MKIGSTKRAIIKALNERNKTVSELSKELGLSKTSVYQHLVALHSKGVVERITNGNVFVYYKLTEKGREILDLMLSGIISTLSSILAYVFTQSFQDFQNFRDVQVKQVRYAGGGAFPLPTFHLHYPSHSTSPTMAAILAFIFVFIITFFSFKLHRDYQSNNKI